MFQNSEFYLDALLFGEWLTHLLLFVNILGVPLAPSYWASAIANGTCKRIRTKARQTQRRPSKLKDLPVRSYSSYIEDNCTQYPG